MTSATETSAGILTDLIARLDVALAKAKKYKESPDPQLLKELKISLVGVIQSASDANLLL